jgi:hypothetical protein
LNPRGYDVLATTLKIIKILSIVSVAGCLGYDVLAAGPYD